MITRNTFQGYVKLLLVIPIFLTACETLGPSNQVNADRIVSGIFLESEVAKFGLPQGVEARRIFNPGLAVTKVSEGFIPTLYDDPAGYCTIAYGHLVKRKRCNGDEPEEFLDGVTEPEGEQVLHKDMNRAEIAVTALARSDLTDGEFAALVDFTFNIGTGNFQRSTLLRVVNNGDYQKVPKEFRKWVLADGKKYRGLQERREREIKLFFNGVARGGQPEEGELIDIRKGEPM